MFAQHQPIIARYAQSNACALEHVAQFVIVTARVPLHRVASDLEDARTRGDRSILFGWKSRAFTDWRLDRDAIYWNLMDQQGDADYMLAYLTHCHGLGLAKAGFLLQLTFGLSGCIDTHNARRYGVDMAARTFRIEDRPTKPATRLAKAKRYNALVETMGGTESLWDTWCEYVAANQADFYNDADHVSRLHIEALNL